MAVQQGCARWEHGVDGFQVRVALLRVRGDRHLLVVATFQHHHGDGAGEVFALWGSRACRLRRWWVLLYHVPEFAPPVWGHHAFPVRQVIVRPDVEGVSPRLWGGPFLAPGAWRGPGLRRRRNERVRPAQVGDPHTSLVQLVEVEPPDPRVDKVVRDLPPMGDECLDLPYGDVSGCSVRQGYHGEEPVWVEVLEVSPEGCHPPAWGFVGVDVLNCLQFLSVREVCVPSLWCSGGWGGHGLPVPVRCGASW